MGATRSVPAKSEHSLLSHAAAEIFSAEKTDIVSGLRFCPC